MISEFVILGVGNFWEGEETKGNSSVISIRGWVMLFRLRNMYNSIILASV